MAKLSAGDVVSVSSLVKRGVSNVEIARLLGVTAGRGKVPVLATGCPRVVHGATHLHTYYHLSGGSK